MSFSLLVTGMMSGSSLDGVDMALIRLNFHPEGSIAYELLAGHTEPYPLGWRDRLVNAPEMHAHSLLQLHSLAGKLYGSMLKDWHEREGIRPDLASCHGHTVFHESEGPERFSFQLGEGAAIAAACGIPVVTDFRNADMAVGGRGAPMAPLVDLGLFPEYSAWVNLGGIANITLRVSEKHTMAWDICAANQLLNYIAGLKGMSYDEDGFLARSGHINEELLLALATRDWHRLPLPKAMSNHRVQNEFVTMLQCTNLSPEDMLATVVRYIAVEIKQSLTYSAAASGKVLFSGGGVRNRYLMEEIEKELCNLGWEPIIPDEMTIDYKECILIALAGALRIQGMPNHIAQISGAKSAAIGGAVYYPPSPYLR